jgi:putative ABC transport system substrate-binding protein
MPDPTATQQAAIEASIGSAQKFAMRIVDLPKDKREAGIEFVRRNYADALEKFGIDGEQAAWPLAARAQQRGVPVVGFLRGGTPAGGANLLAAFRKGLSETGFVEGRNLAIEFRWGLDSRERQAEAAADMVRRNVDVIVAPGFSVAALAAKALTATIPIVFATSGDPVQLGLVASLSHHAYNFSQMPEPSPIGT